MNQGENEYQIILSDRDVIPQELKIKSGCMVCWKNCSNCIHTVVFKTGDYESRDLKEGDSFELYFKGLGNYDYYCEDDEGIAGRIIVE